MDNIENGVHQFHSEQESTYVEPEAEVRRSLDRWQDMKLGFMVHWGVYSQWGIVESWSLSNDDESWSRRDVRNFSERELKEKYGKLHTTFDPVFFDPDEWADAAAGGGFKYFVFTTKHHDGFAMYDTKVSDYKITSPDCPYHSKPNANIAKCLFDSFRSKGLGIGAYFSKPDWRCPYYWEPGAGSRFPSRGPTYTPTIDKDKWERFKKYTRAQINELATDLGPLDILWLDGGWVNPLEDGQDLDIARIAADVRRILPGLLIVDRTVGGPFENYVTPEQLIPKTPMFIPWESNITMGTSFSYRFDDEYKTERELIHMIADVTAKGGNLVLNAGAEPTGRLPKPALALMKSIGAWMGRFGEAIYGTRPCPPYRAGNLAFTQKDGAKYAIYMPAEGETVKELVLPVSGKANSVVLLGRNAALPFFQKHGTLSVALPPPAPEEAVAFAVKIA